MRKVLLPLVGIAVLWLPAVSVAGDSSTGQSNPAATKASDAHSAVNDPASTCTIQRSELKNSRSAGANVFGRCVSTIAKAKSDSGDKNQRENDTRGEGSDSAGSDGKDNAESRGKDRANPARTCKTMQANDLVHFQATYGTRPNAFGQCVAEHASGKRR